MRSHKIRGSGDENVIKLRYLKNKGSKDVDLYADVFPKNMVRGSVLGKVRMRK